MRKWLSWVMHDERLLPREERGVHPIVDDYPVDIVGELHLLKCQVGRLWDQVWWMNLPWYKRLGWLCLGFRAPIEHFYLRSDERWK